MDQTHLKFLRLAFLKALLDLLVLRALLVLPDQLDLPEMMVQMVVQARLVLLDLLVRLGLREVMVLLPDSELRLRQQDQ